MKRPILYLKIFGLSLALSLAWQYYQSRIFIEFIQQLIIQFAILYGIMGIGIVACRFRHQSELPLTRYLHGRIRTGVRTLAFTNTALFFVLVFIAWNITYPSVQSSRALFLQATLINLTSLAVIALSALLVSQRKMRALFHLPLLMGSLVLGYECLRSQIDPPFDESTALHPVMALPYSAINGPNGRLTNTHHNIPQRRYISFLLPNAGPFQSDGGENIAIRDRRARGTPVYAPATATVYNIVDHLPDLPIGTEDISHPPGNYLSLQLAPNRFLFLANLQQHSITVKPGDQVHPGQMLGRLGKNGSFTESCLVLLLVDNPNVISPQTRSLPFYFTGLTDGVNRFPRASATITPKLPLDSTSRDDP